MRKPLRFTSLDIGRKHRPDYWLLVWCAALLAVGLVVVYAISPALSVSRNVSSDYYVDKQALAIGLSFVAFAITSRVPLQRWRQAYKPLLAVAALATLLAMVLPVNPNYPAHRWVRLGSFSFQSVELVKFAIMVWLAGFLAERIKHGEIANFSKTLKPLLVALVATGVIVAGVQSDLGSTGVIIAMMATMAYVAGLPLKRIAMIAGLVCVLLVIAISSTPYRRARLETYLHPAANCQTSGYQACQAMIAVGSGGLAGRGLGDSVQAYGWLPESANDSIFAIYAEQFGFIGSALLLILFTVFFSRLKSISERVSDDFSRLLVVGTLAWLSSQALVNVGAMIGILPLKGITLPFISYGGTSVVFAAAAVGLAYQVSQYASFNVPRVSEASNPAPTGRNFRSNTLRRAEYS